MKATLISLLMIICCLVTSAQSSNSTNRQTPDQCQIGNYQLFPTTNMWTFLKLDTRNGRIWQVQFDINGDNRMEVDLSTVKRNSDGKETQGRFTLYPTQNMYNFILLDKETGTTWQVQWSIEFLNRIVIPIQAK